MTPAPIEAPAAASSAPNRVHSSRPQRSGLRTLAAAAIVAAGFLLVAGLFGRSLSDRNAASRDYIEYWSEGQLLAQRADPFDPTAILKMERAAGLDRSIPRVSFSPPVALWFTVPLGYVSPRTGLLWWLMAQFAALSLALWLLWILNGRPDSRWHLLGYGFSPVIACEMAGQLSIFFLLCLVVFLLQHRKHPFLAGAALMPLVLKPHTVIPFALVLLVWVVLRRSYSLLGGFAAALAASCAASLYLAPHAWAQYRQMMAMSGVINGFVPAIPVALRFAIHRNAVWIQFVPEVCACAWALWYFWTRRDRWNWARNGMVVLMVAAVCTPYGWFFDEAILLPAILTGLYSALENRRSVVPLIVVAAPSLAEALAGVRLDTHAYLWTSPAWLAWYLYATQTKKAGEAESTASPA